MKLTPHIQEKDLDEIRVETMQEKRCEYHLVGRIRHIKGHTLFQFNTATKELKVAPIQREMMMERFCLQKMNLKSLIMKARIKETGKEFKVRGILTPTADAYAAEEVDLFFDESDKVELLYSEDYWDRLLHQYAGMAMQGIISRHNVEWDVVVNWSVELATALVEKLKKKEERK